MQSQMQVLASSLLEWSSPDGERRLERVLDLDVPRDAAWVISLHSSVGLPRERRLSEIHAALASGQAQLLQSDPFSYLQKPEDSIPPKHRIRRDARMALIKPIITASDRGAFDPRTRARLVKEASEKSGRAKRHFYDYLRRYWQAGMTTNALLSDFHRCGAPGKTRKTGSRKRGRPRLLARLNGAPPGINIGPDEAGKLRRGYREFFEKTPEDGGRTLRMAYLQTLRKYFHVGVERRDGVLVEVLPPADELPTFDQFLYWARKGLDESDSLLRRHGERKFNLRMRPVLGDSTLMGFGPGSQLQIDSTPSDVWVVSGLDRSRRLGRPLVYFTVDTFSHLITGFHAGLENPSFFAAGLALENSTVAKVEYCSRFGIQISEDEWPSRGLAEAVLADRGELEGHDASSIANALGIRVLNTSPFRADLKGICERAFRCMNDLLNHSLPGAVRKPKERGERDPRLDAALTLHEFRVLLIRSVLLHNERRIESYRLQPDMIADGVEPRPNDLWAWGIVNRSGHLRSADPEVVRSNLLPTSKATVTHRGIKFKGLFYSTDLAMREGWYVKARSSKSWQIPAAFDPRCTDTIWLRDCPGAALVPCHLVEADQRFVGKAWEDIEDLALLQKEARDDSKTADLQSRVDHQAHVDAVVEKAVEEAAIANQGLTKAARLRGVRENRKAERRKDWAQAIATPVVAQSPGKDMDANHAPMSDAPPEKDNIPPPSLLDLFRAQRDSVPKES